MSDMHTVKENVEGSGTVMFEPTDFYHHEVLVFNTKHASMRDKVESFNEATGFWEIDPFLNSNHPKTHLDDKCREGRKLRLADFHKKFMYKPL